ncbi:MAG: hypothetical protein QOE58_2532 [Actinomycetota bacterium]|nr:hypothetical protein [Actinomycetota bacterium]
MTCITLLLLGTLVYAAANVQGWIGGPKVVASPKCSGPVSKQALAPRDVTVNVYNASDKTGLAAVVGRSLEEQGFLVATVDNDPLGKSLLTLGEIRHGPSGTAGAMLAAARLPGARLVQDDRMDASVDLVLGRKFKALHALSRSQASNAAKAASRCTALS